MRWRWSSARPLLFSSPSTENSRTRRQNSPQALAKHLVRPDSHLTGNLNAPLTVVEFGDFECPACGISEEAARQIRAQYGDRIRFVFRQFPLSKIHPMAEKAAEASECIAEQGKFWEGVEKLYSQQTDLSVDALKRYAGELGLDQNRFNQCLDGGQMASRVKRDLADGHALKVIGTPTFFIGRKMIVRPLDFDTFSLLVDQELAADRRRDARRHKLLSWRRTRAVVFSFQIPSSYPQRDKGAGGQCRIWFLVWFEPGEGYSPPHRHRLALVARPMRTRSSRR